jgi:starch-binding outer membrane protein, SusD/RagB family
MKNTFFSILCLFLMLQTFTSCSDTFLNEKTYSAYAPTTLTDSLGFQASLKGLYTQMSYYYTYNENQGWVAVWQTGTDIAYSTANQQGQEIPYYSYDKLVATDGAASYTWKWAYQMINNANNIITSVESPSITGITQGGKDKINAEARFFRAYAYNMLATLFGRVPVITKTITGPKTDFVRAPLDSVNALIEKDLLYSAANLPLIDNTNQARTNKAMAQQLLAEAYLRMGKAAEAEVQCQAILSSGKFGLVTSRYGVKKALAGDAFSDMFVYGNQRRSQGNTEAIWVLQQENPTTIVGGSSGAAQQRRVWGAAYYNIAGLAICDSLGGRGIARLRLNNWVLYKLYANTDMRNSRFNIRRRYTYNDPAYPAKLGQLVPYTGADTLLKICPSTTKWSAFDPLDVFGYGMIKDIPIMRLGETYLLLAEAQFKQGGAHINDAVTTINTLRARSNAAAITSSQLSLDFILDERARELLAEENRRMTLMRTDMLGKRALRLNNDVTSIHPIVGLDSTTVNKKLLPIPQSEIDLNKDAKLEQNPGY